MVLVDDLVACILLGCVENGIIIILVGLMVSPLCFWCRPGLIPGESGRQGGLKLMNDVLAWRMRQSMDWVAAMFLLWLPLVRRHIKEFRIHLDLLRSYVRWFDLRAGGV